MGIDSYNLSIARGKYRVIFKKSKTFSFFMWCTSKRWRTEEDIYLQADWTFQCQLKVILHDACFPQGGDLVTFLYLCSKKQNHACRK